MMVRRHRDSVPKDLDSALPRRADVQHEPSIGLTLAAAPQRRQAVIWVEWTPRVVFPTDYVKSVLLAESPLRVQLSGPTREIDS
jgi:hypothetical protein